MHLVAPGEHWRWVVVRLAPKLDLLRTILLLKLLLVSSFESPIMSLVDLPGPNWLNVCLIELLEDDHFSLECSGKEGGVGTIELVSQITEKLTGLVCFLPALFVQWNIYPAAATSFFIPNGLAMADKHNFVGPLLVIPLFENKKAFVGVFLERY